MQEKKEAGKKKLPMAGQVEINRDPQPDGILGARLLAGGKVALLGKPQGADKIKKMAVLGFVVDRTRQCSTTCKELTRLCEEVCDGETSFNPLDRRGTKPNDTNHK